MVVERQRRNNDPSIDLPTVAFEPLYCETEGPFYHSGKTERTDPNRIAVGEMFWTGDANDYSKGKGHYLLCASCATRFAINEPKWRVVRW